MDIVSRLVQLSKGPSGPCLETPLKDLRSIILFHCTAYSLTYRDSVSDYHQQNMLGWNIIELRNERQ